MKKRIVSLMVAAVLIGNSKVAAGEVEGVHKYGQQNIPVYNVKISNTKTEKLVEETEDLEEELYLDSLELLAIMVEAEAGNQEELGKRLVVDVVLNRVDSDEFPNSIDEVIRQKNQFSSYTDGGMDRVWEPSASTYAAVKQELEDRTDYSVLYFTAGGYGHYGKPYKKVGDHYFNK